jgi:hypothetical protein
MDHMKKYWPIELECIRKGVNHLDGYVTTISPHYMNRNEILEYIAPKTPL